ncbi:MAG: hypothetical protein ABI317_05135, partial [Gaiellales bacterium]
MGRLKLLLLVGVGALAVAIALGPRSSRAHALTAPYVAIDLGVVYGDVSSSANAINDAGELVGSGSSGSNARAIVWTQGGGMSALQPNGFHPSANAISPNGHIAGGMEPNTVPSHPEPNPVYVWQNAADPAPVSIGTLGGAYASAAGINDSEEVVGFSETTTVNQQHAFVWTPAGGMIDIGTLGGDTSFATAVNASGVVVGWSMTASNLAEHAFRWTPASGMVDLGALILRGSSDARGINDSGEIVGSASTSTSVQTSDAVSWTAAGKIVDLGGLPSSLSSVASAVSNSGQIVGGSAISNVERLFSYTPSGGMVELDGLGGSYPEIAGVNDSGTIVGTSTNAAGQEHATLWQPADAPPVAPARPTLDSDS